MPRLLLVQSVLLLASGLLAQSNPVIEWLGRHGADPGGNAGTRGYVDAQTGTENALVGFGYCSDSPSAGLHKF